MDNKENQTPSDIVIDGDVISQVKYSPNKIETNVIRLKHKNLKLFIFLLIKNTGPTLLCRYVF